MTSNARVSASEAMVGKKQTPVFWVLVLIVTALMVKLSAGQMVPAPTELLVAIVSVAALLLVTGRELKTISVGKDGLKLELAQLQEAINGNREAIAELTLLAMGAETLVNLEKLESGHFGEYEKEPFLGLETELYYLRNRGFVKLIPGSARSIHEIPPHGENLSRYVEITDEGRRYLRLRKNLVGHAS
jgi:hypothetical protein